MSPSLPRLVATFHGAPILFNCTEEENETVLGLLHSPLLVLHAKIDELRADAAILGKLHMHFEKKFHDMMKMAFLECGSLMTISRVPSTRPRTRCVPSYVIWKYWLMDIYRFYLSFHSFQRFPWSILHSSIPSY